MTSFLAFAGLNYHIMHHMFPTLDHSRLKQLDGLFKQTCSDFGLTYQCFDFATLYKAVFMRHDMPLVAKLIPEGGAPTVFPPANNKKAQ